MPAKVLFLTLKTFSLTGGIENVCRTICRTLYDLSEEGVIDPVVFSMYDKNTDRDSRYLTKQQFTGFNFNRKLFVLKAVLKGLKSDIILLSHIHLLSLGYLIKKLRPSVKIFLFAHGIEIWKTLPDSKLKILKSFDKIICVSQFTAKKIHTQHHIPEEKIEVLNNCLDPFYFVSQNFDKPQSLIDRYCLGSENKILFSLSRLSSSEKYKGYDHTIRILPSLLEKHPDLVYLLAGKWDDKEKARLDALVKQLHLEKNIRIIGFVDEAEITDHFLLSDLFIMPSKKEGFGIVFIEAIASGLNVVAGNKDGSVDALKNGKLGALIDPDNLLDIEEKIQNFLNHPQTVNDKVTLQKECIKAFNFEDYKNAIQSLLLTGSTGTKFTNS